MSYLDDSRSTSNSDSYFEKLNGEKALNMTVYTMKRASISLTSQ